MLTREELEKMFACCRPQPQEAEAENAMPPLQDAAEAEPPLHRAGGAPPEPEPQPQLPPPHLANVAAKQRRYISEWLTAALTSTRPLSYVKTELGKAMGAIVTRIAGLLEQYDPDVVDELRSVHALVHCPKATFQEGPLRRLTTAHDSVSKDWPAARVVNRSPWSLGSRGASVGRWASGVGRWALGVGARGPRAQGQGPEGQGPRSEALIKAISIRYWGIGIGVLGIGIDLLLTLRF